MSLWLYLHFPSLQLDSVFSAQNEQAIIIVHGKKNEVVQLNAPALAQGVKAGMGLGTASALCTNLAVHPYNRDTEVTKLKEIAHWLYLVTSDITFFEPDGILLRISNMLSLYGGLQDYWHVLQGHMQTLNLNYHFATAYSPLASRLLARAGNNCIYANEQAALAAVKQHSLTYSELPGKTREKLARVGVHTLADLLNLSMADIARRFDIDLVNYAGRLTGQFKHPVEFYHPPEQFSHFLELSFDVENVEWLKKPLQKLLIQLEKFLKLRDKLAHELVLVLHQRDADKLKITVTCAAGEYQAEKWLTLSSLRLENIALSAPVTGITLAAARIAERQDIKEDLFERQRGQQSPQELVSLLQAKLGSDAVKGVELTDDPRPSLATGLCEPLTSTFLPPRNAHMVRPSILLPSPLPLTSKVTVMQGPERLMTGWWDNKPLHRDYFVARCNSGKWLWIFRNHKQQWFVHGMFC